MLNGIWRLALVRMRGRSFSSEHSASVSMAALRESCICVSETLDHADESYDSKSPERSDKDKSLRFAQ